MRGEVGAVVGSRSQHNSQRAGRQLSGHNIKASGQVGQQGLVGQPANNQTRGLFVVVNSHLESHGTVGWDVGARPNTLHCDVVGIALPNHTANPAGYVKALHIPFLVDKGAHHANRSPVVWPFVAKHQAVVGFAPVATPARVAAHNHSKVVVGFAKHSPLASHPHNATQLTLSRVEHGSIDQVEATSLDAMA